MNKLAHALPHSLKIDDVIYPINTNEQNIMLTLEAFEAVHSGELLDSEAWEIFLENIFQPPYPTNLLKAHELFKKFLYQSKDPDNDKTQYMDFFQDSELIYDALLSIGLTGEQIKALHWYDFISKLSEVENTKFNRVVYLRMKLKGIGGKITKEEREDCNRIGWDVITIKRTLSAEEQAENDFFENMMKKFDC